MLFQIWYLANIIFNKSYINPFGLIETERPLHLAAVQFQHKIQLENQGSDRRPDSDWMDPSWWFPQMSSTGHRIPRSPQASDAYLLENQSNSDFTLNIVHFSIKRRLIITHNFWHQSFIEWSQKGLLNYIFSFPSQISRS